MGPCLHICPIRGLVLRLQQVLTVCWGCLQESPGFQWKSLKDATSSGQPLCIDLS